MVNVGLLSDTHRLLREEAIGCLKGSDLIIHAGDIGSLDVIAGLEKLAPVRAIRGNIDQGSWAEAFPDEDVVKIEDTRILVIHNRNKMTLDPESSGFGVVVSGHSHNPKIESLGGVLYVNPGSAGPRRFKLPVTVAKLRIEGTEVEGSIHEFPLTASRSIRSDAGHYRDIRHGLRCRTDGRACPGRLWRGVRPCARAREV